MGKHYENLKIILTTTYVTLLDTIYLILVGYKYLFIHKYYKF